MIFAARLTVQVDVEFDAERDHDARAVQAIWGMDPDLFFPERGENVGLACSVCAGCPVRVECLDYACNVLPAREPGVYGGLSLRQRDRVRGVRQ